MIDPASLFTRRNAIVFFGGAAAAFAAGFALRKLTRQPGSPPIDWRAAFEAKSEGGEAVVKSLVGEAFAGAKKLALGGAVASGQQVRVGREGTMVLALPDRTVMKISGEAGLVLHIDPKSGGVYNLALGAILTVVPARNLYLAIGPATTIGIKGTVFFRRAWVGGNQKMMGMDGPVPTPEGVNDYFCTCNGEVDYLGDLRRGEVLLRDHARHHNANFMTKDAGGKIGITKAPMLDHFDDEIDQLIDIQEPPRHDKSWLQLPGGSRPKP
jgi:hypothetical protein